MTVVLIVLVQVFPLAWLLLTSFRTAADFAGGDPFAIPSEFTLENYSRAFESGNLWLNILNSLIVTLGASTLIVVAGMMAAYALQVLGFRFSNLVRSLFLLGIIVPVQIALVPLFIDYSQVGLLDTHLSMILPLAAFSLPMGVYLFSSFYEYIPRELYEAASLDGAGPYRIFLQITAPLSVNTIITVVLVNSIFIWNDFIFANTFVLSDGLKNHPTGSPKLHRCDGEYRLDCHVRGRLRHGRAFAAGIPRAEQGHDRRSRERSDQGMSRVHDS
ncbi:carbohydrate ABC transporter permease [Propioniciclava soli]|uniref:Carbohydrate ABC transporter permease n=1 Tax=Propioniciclava soli TaxID=2775081 RepID=A0ABZ3C4Z6_9ACTN